MDDDDSLISSPRSLDPLKFSITLFIILILFVFYLLLPKGVRKQYFGAYPKRHAWSARNLNRTPSVLGSTATTPSESTMNDNSSHNLLMGAAAGQQQQHPEVVVSAAMQQLRSPGVLIVAHGSRGRPKTVRLQLTDTAITWRTENRKKKWGKLHAVPLQAVMYVDVGKQTTALRRVENAAVSEALCFSLLTKEGSLDLEASSVQERDALVSCFSLVLDEVHAQNWRDIYRGPSSDMPSSFDELDPKQNTPQANV